MTPAMRVGPAIRTDAIDFAARTPRENLRRGRAPCPASPRRSSPISSQKQADIVVERHAGVERGLSTAGCGSGKRCGAPGDTIEFVERADDARLGQIGELKAPPSRRRRGRRRRRPSRRADAPPAASARAVAKARSAPCRRRRSAVPSERARRNHRRSPQLERWRGRSSARMTEMIQKRITMVGSLPAAFSRNGDGSGPSGTRACR